MLDEHNQKNNAENKTNSTHDKCPEATWIQHERKNEIAEDGTTIGPETRSNK